MSENNINIRLKEELSEELSSILDYWAKYSVDNTNGGFLGKIDNQNKVYSNAAKGAVLNARILWTFSAAYSSTGKDEYLVVATRAFNYIINHFIDREYGGVFWTVSFEGEMLDSKKQIYALAFCIYGLSEYYIASKNIDALQLALSLYESIERYSYDRKNKGYFEAFARDWSEANDLRLSAKDVNEKKTMNTHLHIIEAYANLYRVAPMVQLRDQIAELLQLFDVHFIDHSTYHLKLFFDEYWNEKSNVISYGHDIEAAWLLLQCAEIIGDKERIDSYKQYAIHIADAVTEGVDKDGGIWYEYDPAHEKMVMEKHWWPQAEAVVGYYNAYEISGNKKYLKHAIASWRFIQQYILDNKFGEWYWGVNADYSIMETEDKVGLWKCPYHNSRACIELMKRVRF